MSGFKNDSHMDMVCHPTHRVGMSIQSSKNATEVLMQPFTDLGAYPSFTALRAEDQMVMQ